MILIPGLAFGSEVFRDFINHYENEYNIYAITPAGFGGTPAPSMPDTAVKYSELSWTNGIVTGIIDLIEKEKLDKPIIVGHFITGTQVVLNLALNYPDKIGKAIIIGGSPYRYYAGLKDGQWSDWENEKKLTPEQRANLVEVFWAPKWFKTVTKKTWDDNMWTPNDYCKDSTIGKQLFKTSADVPLQVMVRYLIEWMAYDVNEKYNEIKAPVLILIPDFYGIFTPATDPSSSKSCEIPVAKKYLKYFHQETWKQAMESGNPMIQVQTVAGTRIFMWYDNPDDTYKSIDDFINKNVR
jgi:pimeloyl-ACP methyl ester carboxylesterase